MTKRFNRITGMAIAILGLHVAPAALAVGPSSVEVEGIAVQIARGAGGAAVEARLLGKFVLEIRVQPEEPREDLTIRVDLPVSGPQAWPAERVEVLNEESVPLPVTRSGDQWHGLEFTVRPVRAVYSLRARLPDAVKLPGESERFVRETTTGVSARICRWFDGKGAALSLRFDDSHPTHLSVVRPMLDDYGFRGTFMINPGRADFQSHKKEWEAVAVSGHHEFANHTMHHRGAGSDEELEREIGDTSKYIWGVYPQRSRLVALSIGGGTFITTVHPLQYFLDTYAVFPVWGSLGMDDVYGDQVSTFRRRLKDHVERGLWCKIHFHSIGEGLATSVDHFVSAMEIVKEFRSDVWVAGLADAFKYQEEWKASTLSAESAAPDEVAIQLNCLSDPELYDQPLTLEVAMPEAWKADEISVSGALGPPVPFVDLRSAGGERLLRFDVAPVTGRYLIRHKITRSTVLSGPK
jgi:hypothetical protein